MFHARDAVKSDVVVRQAEPEEFERVGHLVYELLTEIYPGAAYQRNVFVDAARTLLTGSESICADVYIGL